MLFVPFDQTLGGPLQLSQQGIILEAAIQAAANAVIKLKDTLNDWDSKVGDGDCGSTVGIIVTYILFIYRTKCSEVFILDIFPADVQRCNCYS